MYNVYINVFAAFLGSWQSFALMYNYGEAHQYGAKVWSVHLTQIISQAAKPPAAGVLSITENLESKTAKHSNQWQNLSSLQCSQEAIRDSLTDVSRLKPEQTEQINLPAFCSEEMPESSGSEISLCNTRCVCVWGGRTECFDPTGSKVDVFNHGDLKNQKPVCKFRSLLGDNKVIERSASAWSCNFEYNQFRNMTDYCYQIETPKQIICD